MILLRDAAGSEQCRGDWSRDGLAYFCRLHGAYRILPSLDAPATALAFFVRRPGADVMIRLDRQCAIGDSTTDVALMDRPRSLRVGLQHYYVEVVTESCAQQFRQWSQQHPWWRWVAAAAALLLVAHTISLGARPIDPARTAIQSAAQWEER